jgi:hypothetical protein
MAAPKQQAGLEGDVPFFFFLISGHEKECERESKGPFYTPRPYTRALLYFLCFWSSALYKYGKGGGRLLTCLFVFFLLIG